MDPILTMNRIVEDTVESLVYGAFGFSFGYLGAQLLNQNPLQYGVILGVKAAATCAFSKGFNALGSKLNLNKSTVKLIDACSVVTIDIAFTIGMIALGLFDPISTVAYSLLAMGDFFHKINEAGKHRQYELYQESEISAYER